MPVRRDSIRSQQFRVRQIHAKWPARGTVQWLSIPLPVQRTFHWFDSMPVVHILKEHSIRRQQFRVCQDSRQMASKWNCPVAEHTIACPKGLSFGDSMDKMPVVQLKETQYSKTAVQGSPRIMPNGHHMELSSGSAHHCATNGLSFGVFRWPICV